MGNYTAYKIHVRLRADLPDDALAMLQWMADTSDSDEPAPPVAIPDHPFFGTHRWASILTGHSGYFEWPEQPADAPQILSRLEDGSWQISSASDTKGGTEDLARFFHWLLPWIVMPEEAFQFIFIGEALYEEDSRRWMAFLHDDRLFFAAEIDRPDPQPEIGYGFGDSSGFYDSYDARHDFVEERGLNSDGLDLVKMVTQAKIYSNRLA